MSVDVTYVCGQSGKKIISSQGLPDGWVIPKMDLSTGSEKMGRPLPHHTVVAFSSEEMYRQCMRDRLNRFK